MLRRTLVQYITIHQPGEAAKVYHAGFIAVAKKETLKLFGIAE